VLKQEGALVLVLYVGKVALLSFKNFGSTRRSSTVMQITFDPATTPLCAMGIAIDIALDK